LAAFGCPASSAAYTNDAVDTLAYAQSARFLNRPYRRVSLHIVITNRLNADFLIMSIILSAIPQP
jgi:hypothetical protein